VPIWSSDLKLLPNIEQCDILFIKKVWLEWWYRSRNSGFFVYWSRDLT
jgi:hypothetical protein